MLDRVVLGPTEAAAAAVFGQEPNDFVVSTYRNAGGLDGFGDLRVLQLAAGDGIEPFLDEALARLAAGADLTVTVEYGPVAGLLRSRLAAVPGLRLSAARSLNGVPVVDLAIGDGSADAAAVAWDLLELVGSVPVVEAEAPHPVRLPTGPAARAVRTEPAAEAVSAGPLGRLRGRRKQLTVLASAGLVALLLAAGVLVVIGSSDLGADGVVVTLLLGVVLVQAAMGLLLVLVLRRQAHALSVLDGVEGRLTARLLRRTDRIFDHSRRTRDELTAELVFVHSYLAELGRQQTTQGRALEELAADRADVAPR